MCGTGERRKKKCGTDLVATFSRRNCSAIAACKMYCAIKRHAVRNKNKNCRPKFFEAEFPTGCEKPACVAKAIASRAKHRLEYQAGASHDENE
jgi:hypothetical protein